MEQRSDEIKQDIELTRASLDEKLSLLENKARETFDLNHQISERPWLALGAAIAAGYALGTLGSDTRPSWDGKPITTGDYTQHVNYSDKNPNAASRSERMMAQFDNEINLLKSAAVTMAIGFLRDSVKEYVPVLGQQFKQSMQQGWQEGGKTPTDAPTGSFSPEDRERMTNYDEIPSVQTRFGSPSPVSTSGSEFYEVHTPRTEKDNTEAVRETERYTP